MPLVVPNAALCRLIWNNGGVPSAVNVLGVVNNGNTAITQTLTNTVGAAIKAAYTSSGFAALNNTAISLANVGLRDIRTANQPEFLDAGAAVPGTSANGLLPLNASLVVTLRTARAGRSFRGRVFTWGWTIASNTSSGTAVAGSLTSAKAWIDAINTALAASGFALGVVSRTTSQINQVTVTQVRDAVWDTQRRRAVPGI